MTGGPRFYLTTPSYYVNEQPHIGHVYTSTVADVIARWQRQRGRRTFLLTGTDEHASKVVEAAAQRGLTPQQWADRNATIFQEVAKRYGISHDDFLRTSEPRHRQRVQRYVAALRQTGDVYLGEYEGWYDPGEENYIPDNRAAEHDFRSPVSGRPLVRKREKNYFFRLSAYAPQLLQLFEREPRFVQPEARRNEMVARIRSGLHDVPLSRTGMGSWGIEMPGDREQRIYVWIDALFNYLTAVDTEERRELWPADLHLIGKEILWFHAVIWPALLMALQRTPAYAWVALPRRIYAHSFWIHEGRKMSKSLGNFIDLQMLDGIKDHYGLDALRYYLLSQGPLGAQDTDFALGRFHDLYHAELANKLGNLVSRTLQMTAKFAGSRVPDGGTPAEAERTLAARAGAAAEAVEEHMEGLAVGQALAAILELAARTNRYLDEREPWKAAKDPLRSGSVPTTLRHCCEALYVVARLLEPFLPGTAREIAQRLGLEGLPGPGQAVRFGALPAGLPTRKGEALFPRLEAL